MQHLCNKLTTLVPNAFQLKIKQLKLLIGIENQEDFPVMREYKNITIIFKDIVCNDRQSSKHLNFFSLKNRQEEFGHCKSNTSRSN